MLIYTNAVIHTMNSGDVEAMAVENGKIVALGSLADLRLQYGAREVDLGGACVVPGFTDSHCHVLHTGADMSRLSFRSCRSVEDMIRVGREYIAERKPEPGEWIIGDGFDQNKFDVRELPLKDVADAITTEYPLLLERVCGHVGTLNTTGLKKMNYVAGTVMDGGVVDMGADGEPNGIVRENAMYKVTDSAPKAKTPERLADLMHMAIREMNSFGITRVHSDDLEGMNLDLLDAGVEVLRNTGRMTVRLFEEVEAGTHELLDAFLSHGRVTGCGDDLYKIGNYKLILDGSLGAQTAYMSKPYKGSDNRGFLCYEDEMLFSLVRKAHLAGMQMAFHSIGDGSAEQAIRSIELAQAIDGKSRLSRIVHGQYLTDDQIRRMKAANMGVDIQPAFTASDWTVADRVVDPSLVSAAYRWRDLLDAGIICGLGSDSPVETSSPIWGIDCAVNRMDDSYQPVGGWRPDQKLTAAEALHMYTVGGAALAFDDGSLHVGGEADFVVLDRDPLTVAPETIRDIKVLQTYLSGACVYEK